MLSNLDEKSRSLSPPEDGKSINEQNDFIKMNVNSISNSNNSNKSITKKKDYVSENMPFLKNIRKALKKVQTNTYFHAKRKSESSKNSNDNIEIGMPLKIPELSPSAVNSSKNSIGVNSYKATRSYFSINTPENANNNKIFLNSNVSPEKQSRNLKNDQLAKTIQNNGVLIQRTIYNTLNGTSGNMPYYTNYQIQNYQVPNSIINYNGLNTQLNTYYYNQNLVSPSFSYNIEKRY